MVFPGCEISMSIKLTATVYGNPNIGTECPKPECRSRSQETQDQRSYTCSKCGLMYSVVSTEMERSPTLPPKNHSHGPKGAFEVPLITARQWRLPIPGSSQNVLDLDRQIAFFRKVHISMQRLPIVRRRRLHGWRWVCCVCGNEDTKQSDPCLCPECGHNQCSSCNVGDGDSWYIGKSYPGPILDP